MGGKKRHGNGGICKGTLYIEHERDWSVGLGAPLGNGHSDFFFFLVSGIFPGKAESATFLSSQCAVNPQNLIKFDGAIFEKIVSL